ncbi:right-handed parallel beta-helix repeat-containing protein [Rariglobus hedericola]|nr:right-handed parallel beta-helix repeat-containing protein [Rariglobus hedericola]
MSAFAATYHVKPGGSDLADGLSDANAWATIAKVNAASLVAGDQVLFKAGGVYSDATLVPSHSGTSANRIIYGAYGTGAKPILTTAIVLPSSGWTTVGGSVYSRPLPVQTRMVTVNNTYMVRALTQAALLDGQYFWDAAATTLYVKDPAGSPNTTGKIYEAAQRNYVVHSSTGKTYLTFSGLRLEKANYNLAVVVSFSHHHTFENCEFYFASSNGQFASAGVIADRSDGVRVLNCRLAWLEGDGIYVQSGAGAEIIGNEIDHLLDEGGDNGPDCIQINGIKRPISNFIIKDNVVRRESNTTNKGCIIVADASGGTGGLISGNRVYKGKFGIAFYTKNTVVEYNYIEDAGSNDALRSWENLGQENNTIRYNVVNRCLGSGITIGAYVTSPAVAPPQANIHVYNNVFYDTLYGANFRVLMSGSFRNNIIWSSTGTMARRMRFTGPIGTGPGQTFVSDNNIVEDQATGDFAEWMGTDHATITAYRTASGQDTNTVTTNPLWVNAAGGNFHLQTASPAIDAGASFGSLVDFDGNPVPSGGATDIGAHEHGGLLAYEGFDYTTGTLTSASGGLGWTGSWTSTGTGVAEVLTGSLAWTGLPATGNHLRIYDATGGNQEITRTLTKTFGALSETYWISFLAKKRNSGRVAYLDLGSFSFKASSGNWQVKTSSTSFTDITGSNYAGLHLIVVRVDATVSGDTVYVWVDPVVASGEPSTTTAAVTLSDPGFTFNTVSIKHGPFGNHTQSCEWDELRFGQSFNAVVTGP